MRPVRRETRPANVKGHWLLRRCTSTGRGVYSQILFVWSAQNHSGYMGGESTNDQDECSQMYFHLIYQGLNFSLGSSITIWYLIRDVWLQSSDHFKLRLLFKPIFNHTFNPIFKSVSVLIMSMYVLLYYVPVHCSHSEHDENKTQSKKYMSDGRSPRISRWDGRWELKKKRGDGRVASEYWPRDSQRPGNSEEWIMSNVDGAEIGNWMSDKSPRHRSKSLSRWRTSKELTSPERDGAY